MEDATGVEEEEAEGTELVYTNSRLLQQQRRERRRPRMDAFGMAMLIIMVIFVSVASRSTNKIIICIVIIIFDIPIPVDRYPFTEALEKGVCFISFHLYGITTFERASN